MIGNIDNLMILSNGIFQKKEVKPAFNQIAGIAQYLWDRGWAERNAGNFSINVTGFFSEKERNRLSGFPSFPLSKRYPGLTGTLFLLSGSGTRMRDMAKNPSENICFVYISDSGSAYHIINENPENSALKPTSELATHLAIQQQLLQTTSSEKVVLHAHVTELIALTHLAPYTSEAAINSLVWGMHPETSLFLPDGVGFIPFKLPGSENIAMATLKGFEKHKVVLWEKHGCMAIGNSIDEAFDNLDLLAKSAKIYFLSRSAGMEPEGLTTDQLHEIRDSGIIFRDDLDYFRFMI
jgi:rhamnulose-1-phosphate aldolase